MDLTHALEKIKQSEYKLTSPRQRILEAIFSVKGPFSANSLRTKLLKKATLTADVVTIYRNLAIFDELKIISRCDFSDDEVMYEVAHDGHDHHHHIVCKSCRKVEPLEFCVVQGQEHILQTLGYRDLTHRLEFSGICPECTNKKHKN